MNFSLYIARRYLISKKSKNVINLISMIALGGITLGTMALVIVLSVFNGFDELIKTLFSTFDPSLKITSIVGKTFDPNTAEFEEIRNMDEVIHFSEAIEEVALLRYNDRQYFSTIKGVDSAYTEMSGLDTMLIDGKFKLTEGDLNYAVIGSGVATKLSARPNFVEAIKITVPRKKKVTSVFQKRINSKHILLAGVFSVQHDLDMKYTLVPITFARELLEMKNEVNSIELNIDEHADIKAIQRRIENLLGENFEVKNRYEQHSTLFNIMKGEKLAIYMIFVFIFLIICFNLIASLTMLMLDKKNDIMVLDSMGADRSRIGRIFLYESWLIILLGSIIGLILGYLVSLGQIHFGWVKLAEGSFIISAYPLAIQWLDYVFVFLSVIGIGGLLSWLPVRMVPSMLFSKDNR